MIHLLKDKLKPNFVYNHWIYDYYDSIYIENRQDIDCFKMLFLIRFKIYYNFINDNYDVNDITSNCMNLRQVRDTLDRFNDTIHHINYVPIVIPPVDHFTYQIVTWIIFGLVLFSLAFIFIRGLNNNKKNNNKKPTIEFKGEEESNKIEDEVVNEVIISNNIESFSQTKREIEEISALDDLKR